MRNILIVSLIAFVFYSCATVEQKYISKISDNIPPNPPDINKLASNVKTKDEAMKIYRENVIIPYHLLGEAGGTWVFTIGESTKGYTEPKMREYLGVSSGGVKRALGPKLYIPGAIIYLVGFTPFIEMGFPLRAELIFSGLDFIFGGFSLTESADNDTYRKAIEYNTELANKLGLEIKKDDTADYYNPSIILKEVQYEENFKNPIFAGFLDAISPVGGIGCIYSHRYVLGTITMLGSAGTLGATIYGYSKDNAGVMWAGGIGYFIFKYIGISGAGFGAINYNTELRKELKLPVTPPEMENLSMINQSPSKYNFKLSYSIEF